MATVEQIFRAASGFVVRVQPDREVVYVQPDGELDLATAPELDGEVQELITAGFAQLVIDLRGLSFTDVAGIRLLLCLTGQARREGWRLSLIPGGDRVQRVVELTQALDLLPFASLTTPIS